MQLQIECNQILLQQSCWICNRLFETPAAKVLVYSDQGAYCGEVCPTCLKNGFDWLSDRFEQLHQVKRRVMIQ